MALRAEGGEPNLAQSLPGSRPLPTRPCCPLAREEAGPCRKKGWSSLQLWAGVAGLCERRLWGLYGTACIFTKGPVVLYRPASGPHCALLPGLPGFAKAAFNR